MILSRWDEIQEKFYIGEVKISLYKSLKKRLHSLRNELSTNYIETDLWLGWMFENHDSVSPYVACCLMFLCPTDTKVGNCNRLP